MSMSDENLNLGNISASRTNDDTPAPVLPRHMAILDVETVPDGSNEPRIVEVCVIRLDAFGKPHAFSTLVDPMLPTWEIDANKWARQPHGISPSMVAPAPEWRAVLPIVSKMCAGATIVAHNASYERRVMIRECARLGENWRHRHLCTLKLSRMLYPQWCRRTANGPGHSLETLARAFEIENAAPHRAPGDAMCTMWILLRMLMEHADRADLRQVVRSCMDRAMQPD